MNINFHAKIPNKLGNNCNLVHSPTISEAEKRSGRIRFSVRDCKNIYNDKRTEKTGLGDSTLSKRTRDIFCKSRKMDKLFQNRGFVTKELRARKLSMNTSNIKKRKKKEIQRSPMKLPQKYKIGLNLWKLSSHKQVIIDQKKLTQKEKIIQNIFYKNEKYYYSNKVNFPSILKKIYYDNYRIEDIKDYILPCFKKLSDEKSFFEILIKEAKSFAESVRKVITKKVIKLVMSPEKFKKVIQTNLNPDSNYFKVFSKYSKKYIDTINCLYDHYKHLEVINFEIDKLTKIYLENYIDREKQVPLNMFRFHQRMFINCVYNDSLIHDFIVFLLKFFESNNFHVKYYWRSSKKIYEIYENLELSINDNDSFSTEIAPKGSICSEQSKVFSKDDVLVLSDEIKKRQEKELENKEKENLLEEMRKAERKNRNSKKKDKEKKKIKKINFLVKKILKI